MHVDGSLLSGMGTLLVGISALGGGLTIWAKRHPIGNFFRSVPALAEERDRALAKAAAHEALALDQKQRAEIARDEADSWKSTCDAMERRLAAVEHVVPKFNALMGYTRKVVDYAGCLNAALISHGIATAHEMPEVPDILREDFA